MLIKELTNKCACRIKNVKTAVYQLPATSELPGVKYFFKLCLFFQFYFCAFINLKDNTASVVH